MYGGIGDHLLANRFVPSVLEHHNINKVDIIRPYLNSIDEYIGKNYPLFLKDSFDFYENVVFVKKTSNNNFSDLWINMQQTTCEFDEFKNYDKVYNFVPDALVWSSYIHLPLAKYFKFFPQPKLNLQNDNRDYVFFFPAARENQHESHKFSIEYAKQFVDFAYDNNINLLCPVDRENKFLINYCNEINLNIEYCNLNELWQFSKNCKSVISCDSGPRYFPLHFGKPEVIVTNFFNKEFLIRWLLNSNWVMEMNSKPSEVFQRLSILSNKINQCIYS